jgi:hypothetical protein
MFYNTKKSIVVKLLLIWISAAQCFAAKPIFIAGESFNEDHVPILSNRIFFIPDDKNSKALALLGDKDFVKLSTSDLPQLFTNKNFDSQSMIAEQAKQAREYAASLEQQASDPFFETSKDWLLETAKEHYKFADYTDKLSQNLIPYLIGAKIKYKKTGNFNSYLKGDILFLHHGSLGSTKTVTEKVPVVIFVEKEIHKVIVSTSIAK